MSHRGSSSNSGHYVADVYRFDTASWWRYDDTVVTQTRYLLPAILINLTVSSTRSLASVRAGSSRRNGYIFLYMHQPLWEACQGEARPPRDGGQEASSRDGGQEATGGR